MRRLIYRGGASCFCLSPLYYDHWDTIRPTASQAGRALADAVRASGDLKDRSLSGGSISSGGSVPVTSVPVVAAGSMRPAAFGIGMTRPTMIPVSLLVGVSSASPNPIAVDPYIVGTRRYA